MTIMHENLLYYQWFRDVISYMLKP